MSSRNRRDLDMSVPTGFKLWFAFCALIGVALVGFAVWAVYMLVTWVTSQ